ncbi:sigma-54-dependent transcriptional regulator [Neolewinella antarctica]|uniref:DNA-binding NtrC family response regulator n=1 Tax=Neolewinella antarctica TaxID=442734 RepID=A0ABX0X9Y1_9BACT|nr:sigma-54 dependent transcriptional regulator [Neolewinella antarctica]NJC26066.1 DNA-binding NtrC family response regulator [Neolewinella antarctica]
MKHTILIIEDDTIVAKSLELLLKRAGYAVRSVTRMTEALPAVNDCRPSLVLLDMNFTIDTSGKDGMKILGQILAEQPQLPIILMTGWATVQLAVEGMKAGARDFIAKPWDNKELLNAVATQVEQASMAFGAVAGASQVGKEQNPFGGIIGSSPNLETILDQAARVAPTQASVLITGESGTGKELVAEAIHAASLRAKGPFVAVNLGGVPPSLFESELFGHKAGAFTDAKTDRKGHFELAEDGTLFLDEIGDLDLAAQVKLLRVLQERQYQRLGDSKIRKTNVRILSATSRNLHSMTAAGTFREDLLYRINLIHLPLPPLRDRPADIPGLAEHFLASARRRYDRPELTWSKDALGWLRKQSFPGNIRQLQNLVERVAILTHEPRLQVLHLEAHYRKKQAESLTPSGVTLAEMEVRMIEGALGRNGNEIAATARELGLTRAALYRRIEKFRIKQ